MVLPAELAGRRFDILDVGVHGSLGVVDIELAVDSAHPFRLGREGDVLDLTARVVRVTPSREPGRWRTAVTFDASTRGAQHQIGALITRLLRGQRSR